MQTILIVLAILAGVILLYAFLLRPWLKQQPNVAWFFAKVEPIEQMLWAKSRSILFARLLSGGGILISVYDFVAVIAPGLDITPITSRLLADVPSDMRPIVVSSGIAVIGAIVEWLRRITTVPVADKE